MRPPFYGSLIEIAVQMPSSQGRTICEFKPHARRLTASNVMDEVDDERSWLTAYATSIPAV